MTVIKKSPKRKCSYPQSLLFGQFLGVLLLETGDNSSVFLDQDYVYSVFRKRFPKQSLRDAPACRYHTAKRGFLETDERGYISVDKAFADRWGKYAKASVRVGLSIGQLDLLCTMLENRVIRNGGIHFPKATQLDDIRRFQKEGVGKVNYKRLIDTLAVRKVVRKISKARSYSYVELVDIAWLSSLYEEVTGVPINLTSPRGTLAVPQQTLFDHYPDPDHESCPPSTKDGIASWLKKTVRSFGYGATPELTGALQELSDIVGVELPRPTSSFTLNVCFEATGTDIGDAKQKLREALSSVECDDILVGEIDSTPDVSTSIYGAE